ncbi:6-pyruvoyl-tetrahydropterin synthase-like protein (chromatophore) [Paulinella micropora]|uniref:6-pyruvoyltetrahydropterin synthase n=1 Tax=Paulinella micropora TaxID=1928728 RepID=A0A1L5YBJ0_9EUKA|nr:6-pyruvoyl-tetrahydropterin synthase-like protein [Paulinella micropora]AQX44836.1 6-pyruvoyl-tetrahydropterin synthase-like protein [Paulinella micropora]BBL86050.1 6-pyruvoyl-tetrahydropterin synthase-like protein [Paulinella micropora]
MPLVLPVAMTKVTSIQSPSAVLPSHGYGRLCVITRRATFSASHRYWLPELTEEQNKELFGLCSLIHGHGHNYEVIVGMQGLLNSDGMVINLSQVKQAIFSEVTSQLDFRYLNECWPEFNIDNPEGRLPTTEALVIAIWQRLITYLPLVSLRLYEQPNLWADYLGNAMETFLSIRTHFAAAHRLARPELSQTENEEIYGKCARVNGHGHNYLLNVTVKGDINPRTGMVCDLNKLQAIVQGIIIEAFDHSFLNKDVSYFVTCVPTAENIALHIADLLKHPISEIGVRLHKVRLEESPNNAAEVFPNNYNLNV